MTTAVTVDMAGGQTGGAARFRLEAIDYLRRTGRQDVRALGPTRRLTPAWLALREAAVKRRSRRVALNNFDIPPEEPCLVSPKVPLLRF